ncbi:MAG TPA: SDR family NAD(P)-dependent oxidoreductase [Stellaceae bacterium]|nr:SDR family NAD(P)-dependent oxidoreductase [Stellaceae bacterium]
MNQIDLKGRVAAITGGARGIGYAIAARFVQSGAKVALWDLAGAEPSASELQGAIGIAMDVTQEKSVSAAVVETERRLGPIDILVASAGITGPTLAVADYSLDAWQKVIDIDLTGVFLCNRAVVPGMSRRNYGRIINIASIAGKEGNPKGAAYAAAKAGVIGLTKALGKELAATGVRVNCVAPAVIKTAILDQVSEEFTQFMLSKIPMGRFGTVEEAAALVAWLASEDCSFNTGAVFDLSGGRATY